MSNPHPLRIWKIDKNYGLKLDDLRSRIRQGMKEFGEVSRGVQLVATEMNFELGDLQDFSDLQAFLYRQQTTERFDTHFVKFWDEYRQMFAFDTSLAESLAHTDVSDVPWSEIRLPHSELHLHWGDFGQKRFEIRDFQYVVDGAYIRRAPRESQLFPNDTLLIYFTSQLVHPTYGVAREARKAKGLKFAEPVYDYAISGANASTVGEAMDLGEAEFRKYSLEADLSLHRAARDWAFDAQVVPTSELLYPYSEKFARGSAIIAESIPLLFNLLFYLTQQPDHRVAQFPSDAPKPQIQRLKTEKNETVKKSIRESLARKGYSVIQFIRDPDPSNETSAGPTDRTLRAHWRRGHWRTQRHGKDLAETKWIWIRPVLVKKDSGFEIGTMHQVPEA